MFSTLPEHLQADQEATYIEVSKTQVFGLLASKKEVFGFDEQGVDFPVSLNTIDEYIAYGVPRNEELDVTHSPIESANVLTEDLFIPKSNANSYVITHVYSEVIEANSRGDAIKEMEHRIMNELSDPLCSVKKVS